MPRSLRVLSTLFSLCVASVGCEDPAADESGTTSDELRRFRPGERLGQLAYGDERTVEHSGTPEYRSFSFVAAKGDKIRVQVQSAGDAIVWLLNADNRTIERADGTEAGGVETIDYTVKTAGTFAFAFREAERMPATFTVKLATLSPTGGAAQLGIAGKPKSSSTSIATDAAGNVYFTYSAKAELGSGSWSSGGSTYLSVYDAATASWRDPLYLGYGDDRTKVLVDKSGKVHVIFGTYGSALGDGNMEGVGYRVSNDHGVTFSAQQKIADLAIASGLFDLALDSQDQPHVAFVSRFFDQYVIQYASLTNGQWTAVPVERDTTSYATEPDLEMGPDDAPFIVATMSTFLVDGMAKRAMHEVNGAWVGEQIDLVTRNAGVTGNEYPDGAFTGHSVQIAADGSVDVLFTRKDAFEPALFLAHRAPGAAGTWTKTKLAGATSFVQPTLFRDAAGRRAAISDGVTLHREVAPGTWSSTPLAFEGTQVSQATYGTGLVLGYLDDTHDNLPTVSLVALP